MKLSDYKEKKRQNATERSLITAFLSQYEGKSEDEIVAAIVEVAKRKRREGTLSDAELDGFAAMIRPSLDEKQKSKLDEVVAMLKKKK